MRVLQGNCSEKDDRNAVRGDGMQQNTMAGVSTDQEEYVDELKPGTSLLQGQYKIDRFLNSGGFGITYLAKDSLDRRIVIKECFPGSFCRRSQTVVAARSRAHQNEFKSIVKLFMQEARSLAKLVHPNIVGVHQVFEDNDTAYMAIDFIDGRDLLELIEDDSVSFTPKQIVEMTKKLLSAVSFIHENEILHRDISPDNILIDSDGEPILIDFGAAREQATKASRALSALRVVRDGYSPQEFYVAGSAQGPWSDLYALAASLFHLIKGEPPLNSQVRLAAVAEGRGDPYMPLAGEYDGYPDGFLEAIDKAMQTVPKLRVQDSKEWLDMFQNAEVDENVVPLKFDIPDAAKSINPPTPAVEKVVPAQKPVLDEGPKTPRPQQGQAAPAPQPQPVKKGKGMKLALLGTAAMVAVAIAITFANNTNRTEKAVEGVAPIFSVPTTTHATTETAVSDDSPEATTIAADSVVEKVAAEPQPKTERSESKLQPMVNTTSRTFSEIIASKPLANTPPATGPIARGGDSSSGSAGTMSFADIIASKPAGNGSSTTSAPINATPDAQPNNADSAGTMSFADIIASKPFNATNDGQNVD